MTSLILIPVCVYLGLLIIAFFFADKLIFLPQPSFYKDDPDIIKLKVPTGESISAKYYRNPDAEYTILFSHGNAEDIGDIEPLIWYIRDSGFNVLTYDYRGYGISEGSPTEKNSYEDIDAAYRYLTEDLKVARGKIILHGRSLGGGPSVDLAARESVGGLILESTFTSAFRVVTRIKILPFDKFSNIDKIGGVKCPVLVIHGKNDQTIGFHHGETLFAAARSPKYSFWVDNAGHNDMFDKAGASYLTTIRDFSANLSK
jgi:abhydrolase domain-containing protein 17